MLDGIEVNGIRYEHTAEAEAGVYLATGVRWWGSRVRYRRLGVADKRWKKFLLIDVHPFDLEPIKAAIEMHVARGA